MTVKRCLLLTTIRCAMIAAGFAPLWPETVFSLTTDISPLQPIASKAGDRIGVCVWHMDRRTLGLLPEMSSFLHYTAPTSSAAEDNDSADQPLFTISDKPPPGFESLNEPQTNMLDVYYNGRPLGSLPATYTLTDVTFLQPAQLADLIPNAKDKAAVTQAFTKALPAHADLICSDKKPVPVCNLPDFDKVAVVFDLNKYRADVFVSPDLLLPHTKQSDLLGPSSAGPSLRHDVNLAAAGSNTSGSSSFNLVNQGALGDGAARLNYQTSLAHSGSSSSSSGTPVSSSSPTQFTVQQLNAEWDHNRYLLQLGYIDTTGNTFISNQNILGVNVGTTLNTLLQDKKSAYGSPLVIFLDLPSQVSIYRDNRLLSSSLYPAGQQTLDTTSLPIGSYLLTLKIQDNLGNSREETRFFVKTQDLPPKDYPIYYASAGYLTDVTSSGGSSQGTVLPAPSSTLVAQAGVNKRIGSNWGVTASTIAAQQNAYISSGLFFLLPYYQWQLKPEVIVGSENDYGVALSSRAQIGQAQLNLTARRIWAKDNQDNDGTANDSSVFDPLVQGQSQVNFNMGFPLGKTLINLITQWTKSDDDSNYSYGISSHSILHRFRSSYLELNLSATRSSTETLLAIAALNWNFTGREFSHRLSSSYTQDQSNSTNTGPAVALNSTWRQYDAAQEGLTLGAGIGQSPTQQTANVNVDNINDYSHVTAQSSYTQLIGNNSSDSSAVTQYNANIESQVVWADDARPTLGVGRGQTAGVVVYIDSDQPGQEFQVLGNGQVMKVAKTNEFTPVFLNAYRTYELTIKATSKDFFKYDERPKQVTLYPGNYQYLTWKARQKLVIFTQVLLPNKQPFAQARLENGTDFNYTDEQGYIQLEIYRDTHEVEFVQVDGERCSAQLPTELPIENGFASLDSITCMPLPPLPAPEQLSGEENVKNAVVQSGVE